MISHHPVPFQSSGRPELGPQCGPVGWEEMAKSVSETKRFLVGFSRRGGLLFFVSHRDLNPPNDPYPVPPEYLSAYMADAVKVLKNPSRQREGFVRRWPKAANWPALKP